MKKIIYNLFLFFAHLLIYFSCFLNNPKFCAFLIKLLIFQPKEFIKKKKSNKIIIVLDRFIGGRRDMEIINKLSNQNFNIFFMRRSIAKIIFIYFSKNRKFFLNYLSSKNLSKNSSAQNNFDRERHRIFWTEVIYYLKNSHYKNKFLSFITFAYYYYTEFAIYYGCNKNSIPVKLWNKECFTSEPDIRYRIKMNEHKHVFKYFSKISVYNQIMKKMLIGMDKTNKSKIQVNGFPRIYDFIIKRKQKRKIKNLLFLSFNTKQGVPENINQKVNFNRSYDKVIKILNELAERRDINITIKRKNSNLYKSSFSIHKKIKVFENGTSEKFINQADIIIGHNSSSTIEAMLNGKYVMVPFFEKKQSFKKFLYKFHKSLIYNSENKMKKDILNLINKNVLFPLKSQKYKKTIEYYLGNPKNIIRNCTNFLSS